MTFAQADVTSFRGYDGRFSTILDSGLFQVLAPECRQDYLQSTIRAAVPGASLYILAFAAGALGGGNGPGTEWLRRNRAARRGRDSVGSRRHPLLSWRSTDSASATSPRRPIADATNAAAS